MASGYIMIDTDFSPVADVMDDSDLADLLRAILLSQGDDPTPLMHGQTVKNAFVTMLHRNWVDWKEE